MATNQQLCANNGLTELQSLLSNKTIVTMPVIDSSVQLTTVNSTSNTSSGGYCLSPCLTYTVQGGGICVSCAQGLVVVNNTCLNQSCPILYCSSCISNICVKCKPTFVLISGRCICQSNFTVNIFNSPSSACLCTLPNNNCIFC